MSGVVGLVNTSRSGVVGLVNIYIRYAFSCVFVETLLSLNTTELGFTGMLILPIFFTVVRQIETL